MSGLHCLQTLEFWWKCLKVTNSLAYYSMERITAKKVYDTGPCVSLVQGLLVH
jgi:hypothetical protein